MNDYNLRIKSSIKMGILLVQFFLFEFWPNLTSQLKRSLPEFGFLVQFVSPNWVIVRRIISYLILFIFSITAYADKTDVNDVLTIDKPSISQADLYFPETEHIQPDKSDFKIISSILLSSKSGQRTATITIKNTSTGQRIMTSKDILAVFANGHKKPPLTFKQKFSGNQKLSLNLNFGISTYPILSVYTLNK